MLYSLECHLRGQWASVHLFHATCDSHTAPYVHKRTSCLQQLCIWTLTRTAMSITSLVTLAVGASRRVLGCAMGTWGHDKGALAAVSRPFSGGHETNLQLTTNAGRLLGNKEC